MSDRYFENDLPVKPLVFAVVLNWNGYEDTVKCIKSLQNATYTNLQIIIVDNASTDGSYERLKIDYNDIIMIRSDNNGGYAHGMNLGAKEALKHGAEFILLVNNDIVVEQNFLEPMVNLAIQDANVGLISPKALYQHNTSLIYSAGGEIDLLKCAGVCRYQGYNFHEIPVHRRKISLAEGCFIFVRTVVFQKVGFVSEEYFMYFEDVEFSERVGKIFDIYYLPESVVYHKSGGGISWARYTNTYNYYFTRNRLFHFRNKNYLYRIYVILFSLGVSLAKSAIVILSFILRRNNFKQVLKSINSLWLGVFDGVFLILHLKK